jgi:hypothetical protein
MALHFTTFPIYYSLIFLSFDAMLWCSLRKAQVNTEYFLPNPLLGKVIVAELVWKLSPFIESQGLLPCSKEFPTGPYSHSAESKPRRHTIFLRFILILSFHIYLVIQVDSSTHIFPLSVCNNFFCLYTPATYRICLMLIDFTTV